MDAIWKYEMGLYQTVEPVLIPSLGGKSNVWFDVEEDFFSDPQYTCKQKAALDAFCDINPEIMRQSFVSALSEFAQRMELLPDDAKPGFGPTVYPKVLGKEAREAAAVLNATKKALAEQLPCVFLCDPIVVPVQEKVRANIAHTALVLANTFLRRQWN